MVADNVKNLVRIKQTLNIVSNICMVFQILVVIMVFLCTLYIAMSAVFNNHSMDFMIPFVNYINGLTTSMFGEAIKQSQDGIDGRTVLFILFSIVVAFFIAQLKVGFSTAAKDFDKKIVEEKERVEQAFNKELKDNLESDIRAQDHYIMAFKFDIKWLVKDAFAQSIPSQETLNKVKIEAIGKLFEAVKYIKGVKFSKDGDILILSSGNINNVDNTINKVLATVQALKEEYRKNKYGLRIKIIMDCHKLLTPVNKAYKNIQPLFSLNATNEILCYGNFKNRYLLLPYQQFDVVIKGKYDMDNGSEESVWCLVKKG